MVLVSLGPCLSQGSSSYRPPISACEGHHPALWRGLERVGYPWAGGSPLSSCLTSCPC